MAEVEGKKLEFAGTYKVDGDKLTVKLRFRQRQGRMKRPTPFKA